MSDTVSEPIDIEKEYHSYILRKIIMVVVFFVLCLVTIAISLTVNDLDLKPMEAVQYLFKHITGGEFETTVEKRNDFMIWNFYTPRIAMAIICGCGLAICGILMQSVLANPLADPYTTGVSDGACLGATVAIVTGFTYANVASEMGIVVNAFVGALVPALIIIALSSVVKMTPATTILVGVALSNMFGGLQTLINYLADPEELTAALQWGIGSFMSVHWDDCRIPFLVTLIGGIISAFLYKKLNLITLGENSAKSLGLDVERFKTICLVMVAVMASSLICFVGIIGFVGLVGPHIVRMIIGGDNKFVLPASMLVGSFLLLASDLIARLVIFPDELRAGLIMSIIGAPIFLYIIVSRKSSYGSVY